MPLKPLLAQVINKQDLSLAQAQMAMNIIMEGVATPAQIGSYLTALRMKGETAAEIAGSAAAMRQHLLPVPIRRAADEPLYDIVGTGGDGRHTFNISTTAAFVIAAAAAKVAKHGNRAASSQSGSADLLIALGANLELGPAQLAICVEEVGIGFLYAVKHHPAMRFAIGPRREIAQRTIFNVLGPLTNPAGATHQVLGVYDAALTELMAQVLGELGSAAALVVHGADGLDELSTTGPNQVSYLKNGQRQQFLFDPQEIGLPRTTVAALVGGTPEENGAITRAILSGEEQGARRDIVLLNSAAALCLDDLDWQRGLAQAREAIDSGRALATLDRWIALTHQLANHV